MRIFKPEVFQGNLSDRHYFEGWYFKQVSNRLNQVYSFIPGISLNPGNPHAFIQVINGITGQTQYIEYPVEAFRYNSKSFMVQVGESVFTSEGITLNIDSPLIKVKGRLVFTNQVKYPTSKLSPGIMGWYSFVPFMECKHGVVSVSHHIEGELLIDGDQISFSGGKGYIEKDWGKSFPESWIWFQSNNFLNSDACIMMSIAKIPWLGSFFTGFLGFLYLHGDFYAFSTYNKSVITEFHREGKQVIIGFKNKKYQLRIVATPSNSGVLMAPKSGEMIRHIKESIDSELEITLMDSKGVQLYTDKALRAGLEVMDGIFDIVKVTSV